MVKIKTILWDIDGTLLDFAAAEEASVLSCLQKQGRTAAKEQLNRYKEINTSYWKALEKGEVTKEALYPGRFADWFAEMGFTGLDPVKMNEDYQIALGENPVLRPDALEVLLDLKAAGYRQYVVTNGSTVAQQGKLSKTGIDKIMDGVFISEEMGVPKPQREFFRLCAAGIPDYRSEETVIIGDSLSSDIQGGNNAGIKTIWLNPEGKPNSSDLRIDGEAESLRKIPLLLREWESAPDNSNRDNREE